jgi:hypothetical protein
LGLIFLAFLCQLGHKHIFVASLPFFAFWFGIISINIVNENVDLKPFMLFPLHLKKQRGIFCFPQFLPLLILMASKPLSSLSENFFSFQFNSEF